MATNNQINSNFHQIAVVDANGNVTGIDTSGNITGSYFVGNGSSLTNVVAETATNANTANTANTATTAGTVTTNAQPNITSVGNLTSLTVNGDITATGNVTGAYFVGDGSYLTGITPALQTYMFANVTSDISGYYEMPALGSYVAGAVTVVTTSVTTSETLLAEFATPPAQPGITSIPSGVFQVNFETQRTSGSTNVTYYCYAKIYKRATNGTETLIDTTDNTTVTTSQQVIQQITAAYNTTIISLQSSDRIVVKVYAVASSTVNIALRFDDDTNAFINIPSPPASIATFVPYTGATSNLNLGTNSISANLFTGNISTTTANLGTVANVKIAGGTSAQVLTTDGSGNLSWTTASTAAPAGNTGDLQYNNAGSFGAVPMNFDETGVYISTPVFSYNGLYACVGNIDGTVLNMSEDIFTGNANATGNISANLFIGNGSSLSSLAAANITGTVANATYATSAGSATTANSVAGANVTGWVANANIANTATTASTAATVTTNAQPNITSLGTLTSLATSGDVTVGGNLTVDGTVTTVHSTTVEIDDKNVTLAANATTAAQANGGGITLAGADATMLYTSADDSWNFNKQIVGNLTGTASNANLATYATTANSVAGANVTGTVANATYATTAGSATTAGTVTTNAQPNITSTGTLTSLTVSGTSNLGAVANVTITGGTSGQVLTTNGSNVLSWTTVSGGGGGANIANGNSNVNIATANGNITMSAVGNANIMTITGTGANISGTANISGNLSAGNITALANGNVSGARLISTMANSGANFNIPPMVISSDVRVANLNVANANVSDYVATGTAFNGNFNIGVVSGSYSPVYSNSQFILNPTTGTMYTGILTATGNVTGSRLISTVASGTAPFVVSSTTQVANLRAAAATVADAANAVTFTQATSSAYFIALTPSSILSQTPKANSTFSVDIDAATMTVPNLTTTANITVGSSINVKGFVETVTTANTGTSIAPDASAGTMYNYTANANFTFNGFTNPIAGQSMTVIITQDATGSRLMTSTMKFAGGSKTLSTAPGAVDMLCILYNGSVYLASLAKGYV